MLRALLVLVTVAAPPPASSPLDLDQVLALARLHDPDLRLQEELAELASRLAVDDASWRLELALGLR